MKKLLILFVFSLGLYTSTAQVYWPVWTHHDYNADKINGVSLGIGSYPPKRCDVNGLKIDLLGLGFFLPMGLGEDPFYLGNDSLSLANLDTISFLDTNQYQTNGIYLSLTGDKEDLVNGLSIHPIGGLNTRSNGLSVFGLIGFNSMSNGLMISGLFSSSGVSKGLNISGLYSSAIYMKGLQIALVNRSIKTKGIQFGLWNINEVRSLPLINWNFK